MTARTRRKPTPAGLFSFSRIKTFDQCPLRYRYRYLDGRVEAFRSIESHLGTVIHDVLEWTYEQRRSSTPPLVAVLDHFEELWNDRWDHDIAVVRHGRTPEEYLLEGRSMLERFHGGVLQRDRSQTLALEQRFTLRLTDDVVFTGFADRVGRTSKGRLFVVDYKTARTLGNESEYSEGLQAPLYASCALRRHHDTVAVAGYHYLRHGMTSWHRVDTVRSQTLLDRFVTLARSAMGARDFPPRPGVLCAWCGFNAVCPAAQVREELSGGLAASRHNGAESDHTALG